MIAHKILFIYLMSLCQINFQNSDNVKVDQMISMSRLLESAENNKDIAQIKMMFDNKSVLYTSELLPIFGKEPIVSLYDFIFNKQQIESIKYKRDTIYKEQLNHIEKGTYISKKVHKKEIKIPYKIVYKKKGNNYKIVSLSYGENTNIKRSLPQLPEPTGKYNIGQTQYYYSKNKSKNNRQLSFQIWYPTHSNKDQKAIYQSYDVVKASADFLGFPFFMISYFSEIKAHSALNAESIKDTKFPVLLYNHGYSGFTSVYQTIFEDLASWGYIVVSIGHQDESALLLRADGSVLYNNPQNRFYASRASELRGEEIGRVQNVILNSDDLDENIESYKKLIYMSPLHNQSTRLWANDTKAVYLKLKEINKQDKILKGVFDFDRIGIFGHSVGAATAGQLSYDTKFIKAGINLDGFQFGDLLQHTLKVPFMFVSSNDRNNRYLRALTFRDKSVTSSYQVILKGFTHSNFTDLDYFLSGNNKKVTIQRDLIRFFFDKYLKGSEITMKDMEKRYSEIKISHGN